MKQEDFARVYDAHYPRVFHYLLWRLRDGNAANVLTAEVFATALKVCQKVAGPGRIGSWLVGIADHLASRVQHGGHVDQHTVDAHPGAERDSEELTLGRLDSEMIRSCVDALTAEHREVLLFRIVAGLSAREVGELIGRTEEAVRSLQLRALLELQALSRKVEVLA